MINILKGNYDGKDENNINEPDWFVFFKFEYKLLLMINLIKLIKC